KCRSARCKQARSSISPGTTRRQKTPNSAAFKGREPFTAASWKRANSWSQSRNLDRVSKSKSALGRLVRRDGSDVLFQILHVCEKTDGRDARRAAPQGLAIIREVDSADG